MKGCSPTYITPFFMVIFSIIGTTNQEMKCGVVENPAYDVVHVQGSAGDRLEPDFYNMKINPLYDTSIISDEGHSHKTEAPTDHVYESVDTL